MSSVWSDVSNPQGELFDLVCCSLACGRTHLGWARRNEHMHAGMHGNSAEACLPATAACNPTIDRSPKMHGTHHHFLVWCENCLRGRLSCSSARFICASLLLRDARTIHRVEGRRGASRRAHCRPSARRRLPRSTFISESDVHTSHPMCGLRHCGLHESIQHFVPCARAAAATHIRWVP